MTFYQNVLLYRRVSLYFLPAMIFIGCAGNPFTASAGLFSAASAQDVYQNTSLNSYTIPLLSSSLAMTAQDKVVSHDEMVDIVDGEALSADIGAGGTLADMLDIPEVETISLYVVSTGDTVALVAKKFGVSENTIRWANNLSKKDVLHVGQNLAILPITGVKHKIQKGDTLATIAKKYQADVTDIAEYNGIEKGDRLVVGSIIVVPDGQVTEVKKVTDKKTGVTKTVKVPGTGVSGVSAEKGYYSRPVTLTGNPRIRKTQGFHDRYNAVDVGAPIGTPVLAMADGRVLVTKSVTGWNGGYGGIIIVQHSNGSQTLYAHLSSIQVSIGESVSRGQKIGEVGSTGRSTGPHLHFEIRGISPTPVLY